MIKKILFFFATVLACTTSASAQTSPDSVFVVKNGQVVSAYEIGKDVDCLTFHRPTTTLSNYMKSGDNVVQFKSVYTLSSYGYTYVLASPVENLPADYDAYYNSGEDFLMAVVPDDYLGQTLTLSTEDSYFAYAYWMTPEGEYVAGSTNYDFEEDGYTNATIRIDVSDSEVSVEANFTGGEGTDDFVASYSGPYSSQADASFKFIYDGEEQELKSAFYVYDEDNAQVELYYTNANITDPKKLEDCYYYAHLTVPFSALWSGEFDITGTTDFKFEFVDNINDQTYTLSSGNVGTATGTISVTMNSTNNYATTIDIAGFGGSHSLKANYEGEHLLYDLTVPNAYQLQNGDQVALRSAVVSYGTEMTTLYLSTEEGITTVDGMANADIKIEMPTSFLTGEIKGFSGTEENAKISITYDGVTYNQANCNNGGTTAVAMGGNVSCSLTTSNVAVDFNVYNIYKYENANLSGHYEGPVNW